jgi:predicted nucleic acid-binding protein
MKNIILSLIFMMTATSSFAKAADKLTNKVSQNSIYNSNVSLEEVLEALTRVNNRLGKKEVLTIKLNAETSLDRVLEEIYQVQTELQRGYKIHPDDLIHLACKAKECN